MNNFVKYAIDNGGMLRPLLVPSELTGGTGLMNPSIYNDNGQLKTSIRHVNYTFYHAEKRHFQHQFGVLAYVHPENDIHLRTENYYVELNDDLSIKRYDKVDMSKIDNTYEHLWQFIGLEDVRVVRWDGKLYLSGVRRDTTPNGQGRIELSEIMINDNTVTEVARYRMPVPDKDDSYCEKNWMPIVDYPYHFIKWANPTEVVKFNINTKTTEFVVKKELVEMPFELRGGSQVITIDGKYIGLIHETHFTPTHSGAKDAIYMHRFIVWNQYWQIENYSEAFNFLSGRVEFAAGMCLKDANIYISFAFQDNSAYVMRVSKEALLNFIYGKVN